MAFRTLPALQYLSFDFTLQRYISQSESGGGLINTVEYADPRWTVDIETRGYSNNWQKNDDGLPSLDEIKAIWASLRGGMKSYLIRHPMYICPRLNKDNPQVAQTVGRLAKIENRNIVTVTGVNAALRLSLGDYATFQYNDRRALGQVISAEFNPTGYLIEIEPKLPNYISVGANVYFDRMELIMRPVNDSFSISSGYPQRTAKFQFMESRY